MALQALYLRYRPQTFEDVVGQEHVTYTLRHALSNDRVGHAYLFSGPRGTGKTTMARLLAKALNCLNEDPNQRPDNTCLHCLAMNENRFLDLIEIDAASHTGVDDVRDLRDRIAFAPNEGQYKVYIIDEVHRFSGAAFDALLKTIEEPPPHAIFVLATTEIHKVPQTIKSRCQRFDFRKHSLHELVQRLEDILAFEGLQAETEALALVARQATGSMRDAISLLDQLITGPDVTITLELAQAILGTATDEIVQSLAEALVTGDTAWGLTVINQALDAGTDPRQLARQMLTYLRRVMLVQTGGTELVSMEVSHQALELIENHGRQLPRRALLSALDAFSVAEASTNAGWLPQLPIEMAFLSSVESLYASPEPAQAAAQSGAAQQPGGRESSATEQEPANPSPAETPMDTSGPPVVELTEVNRRWPEVLQACKEMNHRMIQALLNSGSVYAVQGNVLIYQMPSEILRDKIDADETRELIETVLARVFGQPLRIKGRVSNASSTDTEETDDQADQVMASDSVVSFAVNELGGSIRQVEDNEE